MYIFLFLCFIVLMEELSTKFTVLTNKKEYQKKRLQLVNSMLACLCFDKTAENTIAIIIIIIIIIGISLVALNYNSCMFVDIFIAASDV